MESHLRVEITPRLIPLTAREATQAALELGQALQDVNAAKAAGGPAEFARRTSDAAARPFSPRAACSFRWS